jgi:hypothetical protein
MLFFNWNEGFEELKIRRKKCNWNLLCCHELNNFRET